MCGHGSLDLYSTDEFCNRVTRIPFFVSRQNVVLNHAQIALVLSGNASAEIIRWPSSAFSAIQMNVP